MAFKLLTRMYFGEFENFRMWKYLIQIREAVVAMWREIGSFRLKLLALLVYITIKCLPSTITYQFTF